MRVVGDNQVKLALLKSEICPKAIDNQDWTTSACSACNYIVREHCKSPITRHNAGIGIPNNLTAHLEKNIDSTVWPVGGFHMLGGILCHPVHANVWDELAIQTLYKFSRSDMVLKEGNVRTLMKFAIVAGEAIDKSPELIARFDTAVQDLNNRVEKQSGKVYFVVLQQYRKHNWDAKASLKACETIVAEQ
jgi:hypothetical protein